MELEHGADETDIILALDPDGDHVAYQVSEDEWNLETYLKSSEHLLVPENNEDFKYLNR